MEVQHPGQLELDVDHDEQLQLFDPDRRSWDPLPPKIKPELAELPKVKVDIGVIAHLEFEARMARIGGVISRPACDPGGGVAADTIVVIDGQTFSVQVKARSIRSDGSVHFELGHFDGARTKNTDQRRWRKYIGRADLFALASVNEESMVTAWYLIPAYKLQKRTSLTVRPGQWKRLKGGLMPNTYRTKGGVDPKDFATRWLDLFSDFPIGELIPIRN
jgi:hypothetical protein